MNATDAANDKTSTKSHHYYIAFKALFAMQLISPSE